MQKIKLKNIYRKIKPFTETDIITLMNKNINIENLNKKNPFSIPEEYFLELKSEIQNQCIKEGKHSVSSVFQLKTLVPTLGILLVFITLFNNIETTISQIELTENDLIAYLENNLSDELLYEYAILKDEEEDELSDEINYLLEYDMDYNLIINQL